MKKNSVKKRAVMSKGVVIGIPCKGCGKTIRHDYDGYCMDCADEKGISEISHRTSEPQCTKGHESQCQNANSQGCDCSCSGANHGANLSKQKLL